MSAPLDRWYNQRTRIDKRETPHDSGSFHLNTEKRQPYRTREKPAMISIRKGLAEDNSYKDGLTV
jgi:hypothetical protein